MFAVGKKFLISAVLALSAAFAGQAVLAAEPTVDQVYQAMQGGRYIEAQTMMDQVLKAHPTAKAHYIQAVVYAKQGFMSKASTELATADSLDPAGKYASPVALKELRDVIAAPRPALSNNRAVQPSGTTAPQALPQRQAPPPAERSFPWGMLLIGLGVVGFIVWVSRMMNQRNATMQAANGGGMYNGGVQSYPGGAYGPTGGGGGYAPGYGPGPGYGMPGQAPGMGSRIVGGLATGAAVGAGIVAGEALMHHFTDNDRNSGNANAAPQGNDNNWAPAPSYDMGGNDFGVSDSSSWDSGGGGGGGGDGGGGSWD